MTYNNRTDIFWKTLVFFLIISIAPTFGAPIDSLRTEQIEGKLFIIHQVDQGETLYAISRRYKVAIPDIVLYNPSAKLDLEIGVLIRVPLANPKSPVDRTGMTRHEVKAKETLFSIAKTYSISVDEIKTANNLSTNELSIGQMLFVKVSEKIQTVLISVDTSKVTHTLLKGETLYSLSKKYDIEINQIKLWNKLQDNTLSIGQLLIVGEKTVAEQQEVIEKVNIPDTTDTITQVELSNTDIDTTQTTTRTENIHGFEEIIESGIGELIPGSTETRKYLGLHHTAKAGTIMKVRNEMNNKMVFVRIIGRIPNTGDNKKVLLKISKAAYDRLGIIDPRFRIEISYMP